MYSLQTLVERFLGFHGRGGRIGFHNTRKVYEIQISFSRNKCYRSQPHTRLQIIHSCPRTVRAEVSSCDRDRLAHRARNIDCLAPDIKRLPTAALGGGGCGRLGAKGEGAGFKAGSQRGGPPGRAPVPELQGISLNQGTPRRPRQHRLLGSHSHRHGLGTGTGGRGRRTPCCQGGDILGRQDLVGAEMRHQGGGTLWLPTSVS